MMDPQHAQAFFLDVFSQKDQPSEKGELNLASFIHFVSPEGRVQQFGDDIASESVAVINIIGPMLKYSYWYALGAVDIAQLIRICISDRRVTAIVLRIDSGGGQASAVSPLRTAIRNAILGAKIPVIAYCDTAASAAYWVAAECSYVFLDNEINSAVGSIGVYTTWMDIRGYWEELGIKIHEVYAPESSEKNLEMREANEGKYKLLEERVLTPMAKSFQASVKENRPRLKSEDPLKGAMYFANDAIANGLADGIHTLEECIEIARQSNGIINQ